ncbi:MAG TPA: PPC domain-containing protein, partial [Pyrinomonadaceae bacterium]
GPSSNVWGDFFSVRPHKAQTNTWVISSYTLQNGQTGSAVVPNYTWFGREKNGPGTTCAAPTAISYGQTVNGTLANTDCLLAGGSYYDGYTFSGTAGQQILISMSSSAFDTYLYLHAPGGGLLTQDDDGGGGTNSRIPAGSGFLTLPSTGTYTIRASSFSAGSTGSYSLTLTLNSTPPTTGLQYYPLATPVRLLDTRPGGFTACDTPGAALTAGSARTEPARTTCTGIPAAAQAIVGNATAVNTTGAPAGFVTLYPSGASLPTVSNLNYSAGQIVPNAFTVKVGTSDGAFNIYASSGIHFIVDVTGYYAPPGTGGLYYHPLANPVRLLDTRPGGFTACDTPGAALTAGASRTEPARIACTGIPAAASAIVGNATAVNTTGAPGGFVTLYPSGASLPTVSNLNYSAGQVVPNAFVVKLGAGDGAFNIYASSGIHFLVDVAGYFSNEQTDANGTGLLFNPLSSPVRLLDTRPGGFVACDTPGVALTAGAARTEPARITCTGIPLEAQAVVGN